MRISQFRGALPAASLPDGRGERKPAQSDRRVPSKWTQRAPPTTGKARVDVSFVLSNGDEYQIIYRGNVDTNHGTYFNY